MIVSETNITTTEVANALRSGSHDVGTLCTHPSINKWARHKPIRYPKVSGLTENDVRSDWEGTEGDKIDGIFYGLKVTGLATDIAAIHDVKYEYVGRPTGGSNSPFRLGDFRGYDSEAVCNLSATFDKVKVNLEKDSMSISIYYDEYNTTGVQMDRFVSVGDIGEYYPCILVDNYIHALKNVETGTYTKLKSSNIWYRYFKVDINLAQGDSFPYPSPENHRVSFCLLSKIYKYSQYDFEKWTRVNDFNGNLIIELNPIAIPDQTGMNVNFIKVKPLLQATSITDVTTSSFYINFESNGLEFSKYYSFRVSVSVDRAGQQYSFDIVKQVGGVIETKKYVRWLSDLGVQVSKGDFYNVNVSIVYNKELISSYTQGVKV